MHRNRHTGRDIHRIEHLPVTGFYPFRQFIGTAGYGFPQGYLPGTARQCTGNRCTIRSGAPLTGKPSHQRQHRRQTGQTMREDTWRRWFYAHR